MIIINFVSNTPYPTPHHIISHCEPQFLLLDQSLLSENEIHIYTRSLGQKDY